MRTTVGGAAREVADSRLADRVGQHVGERNPLIRDELVTRCTSLVAKFDRHELTQREGADPNTPLNPENAACQQDRHLRGQQPTHERRPLAGSQAFVGRWRPGHHRHCMQNTRSAL